VARIEDYALIGDLQTAALVNRQGSIDWCCFPRFDSGACFASLLGTPDDGRWVLAPTSPLTGCSRAYRTDTLVLESTYETAEGVVRAIDFMPPRGYAPDIVRIVEGVEGFVPMRSELVIRFDFGQIVPWVRRVDHARVAVAGPDALCFRTPAELHGENMTTVSEFSLGPGDRMPFVLTWFPSHEPLPDEIDPDEALEDSISYWHEWANSCVHYGPYHDEIHQSLLLLKALTYEPTGGIVAAPTTSLPEWIGSVRNWDYRFCWLRDATLTLLAMLQAGYKVNVVPGEATAHVDGRFLPGYEDEFFDTLADLVGENVSVDWVSKQHALETTFDGDLVDAITASLLDEDPEAKVAPYLMSGGTDAKHWRKLGIRSFGFAPLRLPADLDFTALFHGVDERVPVDALEFGARVFDRFLDRA